MTIKKLGLFALYTRTEIPKHHPFYAQPDVLWCKNEAEKDWYDVQATLPREGVCFIGVDESGHVITASADPSALFPAGYTVYQVPNSGVDLAACLGTIFDPAAGTFTAAPPPRARSTAMFRARIVMKLTQRQDGTLFDAVTAAIEALPEPDRTIARDAIEYGNTFSIDSPFAARLGAELGLSESQMLDMIEQANSLPV